VLRNQHKIQRGSNDDFTIMNQGQFIDAFSATARQFTFLLGTVGAISLMVGGIGIMNIMLVTVTERTREIGIRKAIGAREFDILSQFLIEAMIMSGLGGLTGVGLGVVTAWTVGNYSPYSTVVRPFSILLALVFSAAVGIFFGFYPATRAAKLDPIEALRYE
jgi:putative ABC transport system permease protein